MTSVFLDKDTYTAQVVKFLEHDILTGSLPAFSRLKSTRELAKQFHVSQQVILSAVKELEKKKLVRSKPRQGVFVCGDTATPDMIDVLFFVFGDNPDRNPFVRNVFSVVSSSAAQGRFNFLTRFVTFPQWKFSDRKFIRRLLKSEITKLTHQFHPACAMILDVGLKRDVMEIYLELPFPLLFIGNFRDGDYRNLSYNRIGFIQNSLDASIQYALKNELRSISVLFSNESRQSEYFRERILRAEKMAKENGILLHWTGVENGYELDWMLREDGRKKALLALERDRSDLVVISPMPNFDVWYNDLIKTGLWSEKKQPRIIAKEIEALEMEPGDILFQYVSRKELVLYHEFLCAKLQELAEGRLHNFRYDYLLKEQLR